MRTIGKRLREKVDIRAGERSLCRGAARSGGPPDRGNLARLYVVVRAATPYSCLDLNAEGANGGSERPTGTIMGDSGGSVGNLPACHPIFGDLESATHYSTSL